MGLTLQNQTLTDWFNRLDWLTANLSLADQKDIRALVADNELDAAMYMAETLNNLIWNDDIDQFGIDEVLSA